MILTFDVELYLVGRLRDPDEMREGWDFVGLFTQWDNAEAACQDAAYFIARAPVDISNEEDEPEMDAVFPHAEEEPGEDDDDA